MPRRYALVYCTPFLFFAGPAFAVTDEIQVYTGEIMPVGEAGLTWHNNYAFDGLKTPDFPGGLVDNHTYSSVTEWALGVTPWFEAGLYLPLFTHSSNQDWTYNGFKLRALFVQPDNANKDFYYGVNFEFSWNEKTWDTQVNTGEIRPIIGWRFGDDRRWSFTFNPILDNNYKGFSRLEFVPATRLDYRIDDTWTVAAEEYDDFGELRTFLPANQQSHQLWGVVDYTGNPISIEAGIGFGLTSATDKLAVKLMLISDLTGPHGPFAN
ncbi:MAG TPA: hypothetical protein VK515_07510 [Rhizomicrobium sp.]|nr:hypothetical protein [Rhizomicrobium sp.]